jgi:anti-sigma B factor antagonist
MKIIERTIGDITILDLDGNLALEANTEFRKQVNAVIDAGARKLIVNFAAARYMDSSGLGELISCYLTLQRMSGQIKLIHLSDRLQTLLAITKLTAIFETFDSETAAVSSFTQPERERSYDKHYRS